MTNKNRVRAVALVVFNGSILLLERKENNKHYFTLPGGGVEQGERVEDAAVRELKEETSIDAKLQRGLYDATYTDGSCAKFFLCEYVIGEPTLPEDSPEAKAMREGDTFYKPQWVPFEKVHLHTVYPIEIVDRFIREIETGFSEEVQHIQLEWK